MSHAIVEIVTVKARGRLATLGEFLQAVIHRRPTGFTLITGYSAESRLNELTFRATSACLDTTSSVSIFIPAGTRPATARNLLQAAANALKGVDSLEPYTPLASAETDDEIQF